MTTNIQNAAIVSNRPGNEGVPYLQYIEVIRTISIYKKLVALSVISNIIVALMGVLYL